MEEHQAEKRTMHMNIRCFLVGDMQKRQHIIIEYCPTDEMIGDFCTKPVGGAKFWRFCNIIMNVSMMEAMNYTQYIIFVF